MTWHAKALQTSYISTPGSGSLGARRRMKRLFLTQYRLVVISRRGGMIGARGQLRQLPPSGTRITDGTASTMNGDDRWPDVLSRRRTRFHGNNIAVVNAGIGGNQIAGPPSTARSPALPRRSIAKSRIERTCSTSPGVTHMIWLEGHQRLQQERQRPA